MKLLTLNTHSLVGEDFERRAAIFIAALARESPDVIALQEVNQRVDAPVLTEPLSRFVPCGGSRPFRADLYVWRLVRALESAGLVYFWTYLPVKLGYGQYDEGLSFLCRAPIVEARSFFVSHSEEYADWRTRMALMIRPEGERAWFCNLHTSWWADEQEPFAEQWGRLLPYVRSDAPVFLMGDFNNPAEVRGEGYDLVSSCGFWDTYALADVRSGGDATARGGIDGWHGRLSSDEGVRIDQIWCNRPISVEEYRTVFNGSDYERVSDHFGVMVNVKEGEWRE